MRSRLWRGNDGGDRGATVTMVGTNLDTPRYIVGESEDPRSLTLETTTAFVLHSRARHLLAYSRLCLRQRAVAFFFPFAFLFHATPPRSLSFSLSLSLCLLFLLFFFPLLSHIDVTLFLLPIVSLAPSEIPIRHFPSLSRMHLIYRAVR